MLLEREGRGITLFNQKWRSAIRQWDDKVAVRQAEPPVSMKSIVTNRRSLKILSRMCQTSMSGDEVERPADLFRVWDIEDLKKHASVRVWLWDGIIVKQGSHFFAC